MYKITEKLHYSIPYYFVQVNKLRNSNTARCALIVDPSRRLILPFPIVVIIKYIKYIREEKASLYSCRGNLVNECSVPVGFSRLRQ